MPSLIQASVFVLLEILTAAVAGTGTSLLVRVGDDATLPCQNGINNPDKCDSADWIRASRYSTVDLVKEGQICVGAERLSVMPDCSLVIKKTRTDDAHLYYCRQEKAGVLTDFQVSVSVITLTRRQDEASQWTDLLCSAATYDSCRHTHTKWLYNGEAVEGCGDVTISPQSVCSVTISFQTSALRSESKFQCEVMDVSTQKKQIFSVISRPSVEDDRDPTPATPTHESEEDQGSVKDIAAPAGWWPYAAAAVAPLVLLLAVVGITQWRRSKGGVSTGDKTPVDDSDADPEDVSYASVSYKRSRIKAQVQRKSDEDEGECVTYSAVRVTSRC